MDMRKKLMGHMEVGLMVVIGRIEMTRRSDRGYFLGEFKKGNPPTFDGDVKKTKGVEAWTSGLKKFFELHEYIDNMKARIAIFSMRGKAGIWLEDVKRVRDIRTKDLSSRGFSRRNTCQKGTTNSKAKEFYELKMRSMTDEEYKFKFLELLRYVPYIKYGKAKVQCFVSG
eukprot:PITA_21272